MNIVVDTSVWSLFLRREKRDDSDAHLRILRHCIEREDCIHLIGPILQELLDGIKHHKQFDLLVEYFTPFPLIDLIRSDFIEAARLKNKCRKRGIQASSIDFLITSVCINRNYPLLTADQDFNYISRHCEVQLLTV